MAENKLEGFEDFDNIMAEGQGTAKPGGAAGELDDLLGKEGGAAEGGESELDSFFEDLSTIDDLEVMQEDEKPAPAAPAPAAAAAPPPPREAKAAPAPKPKAPKKPRAPGKPGRLRRFILFLVLAGLFGGGGYYVYTTYIAGEGKIPWPTFDTSALFPKKPPPKAPVEPPAPPPKPVVRQAAPPKHMGPTFGIQVATCFFDSCVTAYRGMLQAHQYGDVRLQERAGRTEVLEIYSQSTYTERQTAQDLADRINRENRLEGNAFVLEESKAFRISMGSFTDLSRANVVKDTLNQRYHGEVIFGQRLKALPYALKAIVTGKYNSRAEAERALNELRKLDRSMDGAFIVQN